MGLLQQEIEITLNSRNKKHYKNSGYNLPKRVDKKGRLTTPRGSKIIVSVEDLPKKSHVLVLVECDYCGHQFSTKYKDYLNGSVNSLVKKVACKECFSEKMKDVAIETRADRIKDVFDIYPLFHERGFIPMFQPEYYKRNNQHLPYFCKRHPQEVRYTTLINLYKIEGCMDCGIESSIGSRNSNWKGGENSLSNYLRNKIVLWKKDSMSEYNYKCVITNDRFDDIHHRYSFNLIRDESLFNTGLDIRAEINQYTEDELNTITNETIRLHEAYGLGVTLRRDVHRLFHKLYGTGDNTPEQFDEFKIRFNIGEFDDILTDININKNCV